MISLVSSGSTPDAVHKSSLNMTGLNKEGKRQFDEFLLLVESRQLADDTKNDLCSLMLNRLTYEYACPPVSFIKFEDFRNFSQFPRFPNNMNITSQLDNIDRSSSFLVFISHSWLRGHSSCEGWDGTPHPDNVNGDKFQLCVRGIEQLRKTFAPRMKSCYIWVDYGCMNQNSKDLSPELEKYNEIVECCDCIFTPIVDDSFESWYHPISLTTGFHDYKAPLWSNGPNAYLNRAWCRVEMLYASTIPVLEDECSGDKRWTKFNAGLAYHCSKNRRPHFLYGTKEYAAGAIPRLLPPLQHALLRDYHPLNGSITHDSDLDHIRNLMCDLQPYIEANKLNVGYTGETNKENERHGKGRFVYEDGTIYEGSFKNGKKHGQGKLLMTNGDTFEGRWEDNMTFGLGILENIDGSRIKGTWRNGVYQACRSTSLFSPPSWYEGVEGGHLVHRYSDPSIYEGEIQNCLRNGHGVYRDADGSMYEGVWKNGLKHGQGIHRNRDGSVYIGSWNNGEKDGLGCFTDANGADYNGEWKKDQRSGKGIARFVDDSIYDGEWMNDVRHGRGSIKFKNGGSYEGNWVMGERNGHGVYRYVDGGVYEGEFKNGLRQGLGTFRHTDGSEYEGEWHNDMKHGSGVLRNKTGVIVWDGEWHLGNMKKNTLKKVFLNVLASIEKVVVRK